MLTDDGSRRLSSLTSVYLSPPHSCLRLPPPQEFVDLSARNMLTDDGSRRRECASRVESALARVHASPYVVVGVEQCVGVLLLVYAAQTIVPHVTHVRGDVVKCGFGLGETRAGNKGGTAVRLAVAGSSVCLINAHLPAGASHADERNDTFGEITSGLARAYSDRTRGGPFPPPLYHDLCIFFGDLNYRIEAPNDAVRAAVARGQWADLLMADQLTEQQRAGLAFTGFQEAKIGFAPTYKYDAGTSIFDSSEKQRVPSYCDRVLWRAQAGRVAPLAYVSCMHVMASDHKPVAALLQWNTGGGGAAQNTGGGGAAQPQPRAGAGAPAAPTRAGTGAAAARTGAVYDTGEDDDFDTGGGDGADNTGGGFGADNTGGEDEMSLIDFGELSISSSSGATPPLATPPLLVSSSGEQESMDLGAGLDLAGLLGGGNPPPPATQTDFPMSFSHQFSHPAPPSHPLPPASAAFPACFGSPADFTCASGGCGVAGGGGGGGGAGWSGGGCISDSCSCDDWGVLSCDSGGASGGGGSFSGDICGGFSGGAGASRSAAPVGPAASSCAAISFPVDFSSPPPTAGDAHTAGFAVLFAQDDPPPPPPPMHLHPPPPGNRQPPSVAPPRQASAAAADPLADFFSM
jgi:phosphatidylinositol-bisphosphatase